MDFGGLSTSEHKASHLSVPQIPAKEFLEQLEADVFSRLLASLRHYERALWVVCFSDRDMTCDDKPLNRFTLCCGPDNTLKTLEELEQRNWMTPVTPPFDHRHWKYYADNYVSRTELLEELEERCC